MEEKNASRLVKDRPEMEGCRLYAVMFRTVVAIGGDDLKSLGVGDPDELSKEDERKIAEFVVTKKLERLVTAQGDAAKTVEAMDCVGVLDVTDSLEEDEVRETEGGDAR